jgi:hypothetical protein
MRERELHIQEKRVYHIKTKTQKEIKRNQTKKQKGMRKNVNVDNILSLK